MSTLESAYQPATPGPFSIVFIHGLNGDPRHTWMSDPQDPTTFWPVWVGEDSGCDTWVLGYDCALSGWRDSAMSLPAQGTSLLDRLGTKPELEGRPLILVGHSMGGLVIKTAIVHAMTLGVKRNRELAKRIRGVVFIATPHQGSDLASLATAARAPLRTNVQVGDMTAHNDHLLTLNQQFVAQLDELQFEVRTFVETKGMEIGKRFLGVLLGSRVTVVQAGSGDPHVPGEVPISIAANHSTICKPNARHGAQIHDSLMGFIRQCDEAAAQAAAAQRPAAPAADVPANWNWPPRWNFSGYLADKRRGFVGRDWLFDEVRRWYDDGGGAQALLVCADFGVGKSAFMAELACDARGLQIAAHHFCHQDTIETLSPAMFVKSVAAQLAETLPEFRSAVEGDLDARHWLEEAQRDPGSAFERAVIGPLRAIKRPGAPLVLLVDGLDEALDFGATGGSRPATIVQLLASRAKRLPDWLRILVTSRRRLEVLQPMQSAFQCQTLDAEDIRNLDDIREYVAGRCATPALARVLESGGKNADDLASLLSSAQQSGGKFLYAVRVLNDIESGALPLDCLNDLPPGMDGFYLDAFGRRFPESLDYTPIGALLSVLCAQREPMSKEELAAVQCIPEAQVGAMLKQIEDFLRVRARRYAFDHLSLVQWLGGESEEGFPRAGRFSIAQHTAEARIAGWARRELAAGRVHESAYLVRHLGAYLSPAERRVHFASLLIDFRWLDARLRAVGINALLNDFVDVDETRVLKELERALRHGAHVLGHDGSDWLGADLLASQLLGRLQSQTQSEVQALCAQASGWLAGNPKLRPLTDSLRSAEALVRTFEGHAGRVCAIAVLSDGRLASGSGDTTIKVWNPITGACEVTLEGHSEEVTALAVLAAGRLASASRDNTIRLWRLDTGVCEMTLRGPADSVILALTVLANGQLASGSSNEMIKLWNPDTGACEATLEGHASSVFALAVLRDGRLAAGLHNGGIKFWNPITGAYRGTLEGHTQDVSALAVLADGRLASGSGDDTIKLWNPDTGVCEATLEGHTSRVCSLAVLADGRLASGSTDNSIKLWNPVAGVCDATLDGHTDDVRALAALTDGRLVSGSQDTTIKQWDPASDAYDAAPDVPTRKFHALVALTDGRIASESGDAIRLWNPTSGACEASIEQKGWGIALAEMADGRLASTLWREQLMIWNPTSGTWATSHEQTGMIWALAALADGRLAWASEKNTIILWNPLSGAREETPEGHTQGVTAFAVLGDGRLASGSWDSSIKLWNMTTGACEATLEKHSGGICSLAALHDGRLASGGYDNTIKLWNPVSGLCEATLEGHTDQVCALASLADGWIASASFDKTVRVWQVRNGQAKSSVSFVANARFEVLAFSARTAVLAAGDASGRIHFLKVENCRSK